MLYTIDCVQFTTKGLTLYEFINNDEKSLPDELIKRKLKNLKFIADELYIVSYYNNYKEKQIHADNQLMTFEDFSLWYLSKNKSIGNGRSKPYKSDRNTTGDPFTNEIMSFIHKEKYYNDENGIPLIKDALQNNDTFFFDIDMVSFSSNIVLELLKNDTKFSLKNSASHPMRYSWTNSSSKYDNRQKFLNLWKLSKKINSTLFLLNYSDNRDDKYSLIRVDHIDSKLGIQQDLAYEIDHDQLLKWLDLINQDQIFLAQRLLNTLNKEYRDASLWKNDIKDIKLGRNYVSYTDDATHFAEHNLDRRNHSPFVDDAFYLHGNKLKYDELPLEIINNFKEFFDFQLEIKSLLEYGKPISWTKFKKLKQRFGDSGFYKKL